MGNNGRAYFAVANFLGKFPESKMDRIALFAEVPYNYTYDREEKKRNDLIRVENRK